MASVLTYLFAIVPAVVSLTAATLSPEQLAKVPPPVNRTVQFATEVKPILEASCVKCHGKGRTQGDFAIDTRETFLKGGESGKAVMPGASAESSLIHLVAGVDPDSVMPKKGSRLTAEQVGILRAWIDQGVKWDDSITFAKAKPINLFPTEPAVAPKAENGVDSILNSYFKRKQVQWNKAVSDRVFARRVYLDLIGLIPTPQEMETFLGDRRKEKRSRLVQNLLADNRRFAEHWFTFWNDALRNDYRGTGYIDGGRRQITDWLYTALYNNLPYDKFVAQLVNPTPQSEGFAKGIVWRGVVNASQTPEMQAAQNISQIFMGVNLKCASCHDSFINDWTLADAYGLASIYAEGPLEMYRCDKPTGKKAPMKFIYSELGGIDAALPKKERLKQLATIITEKQNGRLSRTMVNRLWAKLMGRGLVEPVDDLEMPAWNKDLLDWLAEDLVAHGYDLKRTLEVITTSRAYQLPSNPLSESASKEFVFKGPLVKRMSAEQYIDAISTITGVWQKNPAAQVSAFKAGNGPSLDQPANPFWIWDRKEAAQKAPAAPIYVRREFVLPEAPTDSGLVIACDNEFTVYVNGVEAGSGKDYSRPSWISLPGLKAGKNVLAIKAVNGAANPDKGPQDNPAGLVFYARVRARSQWNGTLIEKVRDFGSDAKCHWSDQEKSGWTGVAFREGPDWKESAVLGDLKMNPWKLENKFVSQLAGAELHERTRACLVPADPLMVALGRPNREQVMTTRASTATTLQALELTNGGTLAKTLSDGADKILKTSSGSSEKVVKSVFERSLSRKPTNDELKLSTELLGSQPKKEGVEDLLWSLTMLPEFQLIY